MPRPLKSVPADTLGGRIRAARQRLHLSLAQVAGEKYSTSLISQIERNKIEPSPESLKYLAQRLNLSLEDLNLLAKQRREEEVESSRYQHFEDQRALTAQLLELNRPKQALAIISSLVLNEIPTHLRWRIVALRGQCYFATRQFKLALTDFLAAVTFMTRPVPQDQMMEVVLLNLHLAATLRELGQYDPAYNQYVIARSLMDSSTPLRYIAEAHWGTSLVLYEQAFKLEAEQPAKPDEDSQASASAAPEELSESFRTLMEDARTHAENARAMYQSANELLRASLLDCHIALIEQALNQFDSAQRRLQKILDDWLPTLSETTSSSMPIKIPAPSSVSGADLFEKRKSYSEKEQANIVSATACYLASVERRTDRREAALAHIQMALDIGTRTYIVRRADAHMTRGQILADTNDPGAVEAFNMALEELKGTDRLGARIRVHEMLGAYLIRLGRKEEGDAELEKALQLANVPTQFSATATDEYSMVNGQDDSLVKN
jgi:transcriptional regulator with XRE-family HTH domain/predicted negative regulator of RcsB-dependent stress response